MNDNQGHASAVNKIITDMGEPPLTDAERAWVDDKAPAFADGDQARAYLLEHQKTARALNAMSNGALTEIERQALAAAGQQRIHGGPQTKDELVTSILELRFPLAAQARDIYYQSMGVIPARVIS